MLLTMFSLVANYPMQRLLLSLLTSSDPSETLHITNYPLALSIYGARAIFQIEIECPRVSIT